MRRRNPFSNIRQKLDSVFWEYLSALHKDLKRGIITKDMYNNELRNVRNDAIELVNYYYNSFKEVGRSFKLFDIIEE